MKPKRLFRKLREAWFSQVLYRQAHDRVWEDEEDAVYREALNERLRAQYDADTEALLSGEDGMIAPRCSNDLGKR